MWLNRILHYGVYETHLVYFRIWLAKAGGEDIETNQLIWAAAWDFQQFDILSSADSDDPLQPPFKLRNSKWCSVSSLKITE